MVSGSDDLYNRKFTGKLKLKGISKSKIHKPKAVVDNPKAAGATAGVSTVVESSGTGRIVSSGNTIQGFETRFVEEVSVGDTITVRNPISNEHEERTVQAILSNRTLCVDDAFSNDLITTTAYLIRKPAAQEDNKEKPDQREKEGKKLMTVTVREKSGMWSYKTTTKVVNAKMTAEDRLNERVKRSRDKYCW
ncbi:hypothetical protein BgAZ_303830 [Babesia gibsoni]|uniref:Uncharacterized protein n=1 Tax=Babesia gibsoni TaxID=33632 RepID=A0AAD8LHP6_BABGI|nr:hypothetical protein BgAZ_303830 [Babesia gibsoni]